MNAKERQPASWRDNQGNKRQFQGFAGASERIKRLLAYEEYIQGTEWRHKRFKVLERCRNICEGCGVRRATQVHHVRYPRGEMPGSLGWVAREKLYDLVGLCERCHLEVHWGWEK